MVAAAAVAAVGHNVWCHHTGQGSGGVGGGGLHWQGTGRAALHNMLQMNRMRRIK